MRQLLRRLVRGVLCQPAMRARLTPESPAILTAEKSATEAFATTRTGKVVRAQRSKRHSKYEDSKPKEVGSRRPTAKASTSRTGGIEYREADKFKNHEPAKPSFADLVPAPLLLIVSHSAHPNRYPIVPTLTRLYGEEITDAFVLVTTIYGGIRNQGLTAVCEG
jgi:hypothetical protein